MNDRLWSRLLNEKIAHDVFNHEHISRIVTHLRSESTAQCCAEDCMQAISVALVSYKGRAWVAENLKSVMHWAKSCDELAIMILGAWLGLRDVVRGLLEDGVPADRSHKYLGSAMYAAAFNDDEPLAEILLDHGEGAWKMDGAYGDALQLAAYKGSKNVARRLLEVRMHREKSPNPFGYGPYGSPLGAAAAAGNDDIVRLCVQWQRDLRQLGPHLRSPLFYAARSGRARVAKILLDSGEMRPNMDDDFNDTPLCVAVEHNHEDVVSVLLSSDTVRADYQGVRHDKPTPLQIAATNGYANIVRMLLCRRDIEVGGREVGKRPIFMAALNGHTEIANLLLTRDESHYVRLFLPWVASRGLVDMVKMALDSQIVNPNGHDREFRTALHHAVGQDREDLVRLLLQWNETSPNLEDSVGRTPLILAIESRNLPIFRLLLDDKRTSIGKSNLHGMTPLHVACKHGYLTFVESILAREDVNINALDAACQTPLCYAIDSNSDGVIQLLLENKSTDHSQPDNNQGKTPLYMAAKNGHSKLAVMLMQRYKASPNCWCDEFLATPLIMAAARGDLYLISALLKESAVDINEPNKLGHTALGVAASHAQAKAALKLLEQPDVDVHLWAEDRTTIFLMAAHGGHLDILTHLLAKGAHPGICNNIGETPIYVASEKGHYEAVLMLLAQPGVDPNQPTHFRETPLSVAARRGHVAVVRLLLEQGGVCFNPQRQSSQKLLSMVTNTAIEQMLMDAGDRFVGAP
ncbi:ankyrin repeat-containing domain protein [Aspergillus caelatus]|uniref:Ankyrin repeat-containing domain protein n=1 Tax=Aspergillus caelatus TaxID=61420 RepID=A0A5N7A724_9EURO|nr:ankyrin repeat-containing domain protein [Aspergillus caelatus]KAE8365644.1 ankyrin repeat-containing domain protein [Aspergillus caelatus]